MQKPPTPNPPLAKAASVVRKQNLEQFLDSIEKQTWAEAANARLESRASLYFADFYKALDERLAALPEPESAELVQSLPELAEFLSTAASNSLRESFEKYLKSFIDSVAALMKRLEKPLPTTTTAALRTTNEWLKYVSDAQEKAASESADRSELNLALKSLSDERKDVLEPFREYLTELLGFLQTVHWTSLCFCLRARLQYNDEFFERLTERAKMMGGRCVIGAWPAMPIQTRLMLHGLDRNYKRNRELLGRLATAGFYFGVPPEGAADLAEAGDAVFTGLKDILAAKGIIDPISAAERFNTDGRAKIPRTRQAKNQIGAEEEDDLVAEIDALLHISADQSRAAEPISAAAQALLRRFRMSIVAGMMRQPDQLEIYDEDNGGGAAAAALPKFTAAVTVAEGEANFF